MNHIKRASLYIFYVLLAYMPLHIFLSTWIGTTFHVLAFAKIAKDGLLLVGALLAFIPSVRQPWFSKLLKDRLVRLIVVYSALTLLLAFIRPTDQDAEILGVVYNTRFLLFFLYAVLLAHLFDAKHVKKRSLQIVMSSAVVVLLFGIVQYTLLSNNALTHVGYSRANGVLPAFFIDDKPDLERVMSTLRDPNSFGSYIIIISTLAVAGLIRLKNKNIKLAAKGLLVLSLLSLWFTFSRSAWIGFIIGLFVLGLATRKKLPTIPKKLAITTVAVLLVTTTALVVLRHSYFVSNVIFHADSSTKLEDPNQLRVRFLKESVNSIENTPLGKGPGTAGLASIKNSVQGIVLTENYYLQIAIETGVIGLLMFIAILAICTYRLWGFRTSIVAAGLLASFAGLAFTNLLVHIWSNEAVAYTWWGLAGLVISTNSKIKHKQYTK